MTANVRNWQLRCLGSVVALLLLAAIVWRPRAMRSRKNRRLQSRGSNRRDVRRHREGRHRGETDPQGFDAMRVLIENKTDKPLNVKLPEAFAGVPVLARRRRRLADGSST